MDSHIYDNNNNSSNDDPMTNNETNGVIPANSQPLRSMNSEVTEEGYPGQRPIFTQSNYQNINQNQNIHNSVLFRNLSDIDPSQRGRLDDILNNNNNSNNNIRPNRNHNNILGGLNFPTLEMNEYIAQLSAGDIQSIALFQNALERKVETFLNVIETRRQAILTEIEMYHQRMKKTEFLNHPQATNFLSSLQRIRLRAIETETIELQRLRLKILNVVNEYKIAINNYAKSKSEGQEVQNPTPRFYQWIDSLDISEMTSITEGLQELTNYSKEFADCFPDPKFDNTNTSLIHRKTTKVFPLHRLPSEILHLVLDKLSAKIDIVNLLTVCKLWALIIVKILYYRPHINKKKQLDLFLRTMQLKSTKTVFNYRLMIKRLNFSFVGDYMYDQQLYYFIGCKNLERLTLVFCKHITSDPIAAVLEGCRFLQSVDITGIKDISDKVFHTLAESCPRVQGFYVPMAKKVTISALTNFIVSAPMLKRVKITSNVEMSDFLVEKMAEKCPMLVEVDITGCPNVHDESLVKLFTKLTQLREFRVTHNNNVSDKLFIELSKAVDQLPALRLIDFSSCENITDRTNEKLVDLAPKLRNIFLGKCSRITDHSLFNLARLGKNLQTVHFGHCLNLTDQGVRVLVQSCPRIQYVDFACCANLTNRTLYELSDLAKLKRIGLVKCSQMTDEGLLNMISLRGRNDSLERVHLSYCSNITIYPIYELLMACPRLSHLSLTAVPSFLRPDITSFCRPAPSDFSENQRQIFCVFSGKGVHKLRHYLMSLTAPTNGPQTDINEVLARYLITNDMMRQNENLESAIARVTEELNQDSAAILTATGINQVPGLNNDFTFQNIDFERLDNVFNWFSNTYSEVQLTNQDMNYLISLVDKRFCDDPFNGEYEETDGDVVPGANRDLNSEMCHIVRKFHELDERVDDFEVNVASLARIQFQFTGFLLHEMTQSYIQMVDLNRQICQIQERVYASGNLQDIKGLLIWRVLFADKFNELVQKYKVSTVVLRFYLKDCITLLTRQREIALAYERNTFANNDNNENALSNNNNVAVTNTNQSFINAERDVTNINELRDRMPLTAEQMRIIQFGLRNPVPTEGIRPPINDNDNGESQTEDRSETSEDVVLQ